MSEYVFLNQGRYPFSKSTMDLKYVSFIKSNGSYQQSAFMNITPMTKHNMSFLNIEEETIGEKNENMCT